MISPMISETHNVTIEGFPSYKYTLIKTPHLSIRTPKKTDWQDWIEVRSRNKKHLTPFEPKWNEGWDERKWFTRKLARQEKEWKEDHGYAFLLFERPSGSLIGGININNVSRGAAQYGWLGYWIDKDKEGQSLMYEGLDAILRFSFSVLKLKRMNAATLKKNARSQKLLKRLGFEEEGFAKAYVEIDGVRQDHILFGLNKP